MSRAAASRMTVTFVCRCGQVATVLGEHGGEIWANAADAGWGVLSQRCPRCFEDVKRRLPGRPAPIQEAHGAR